VRQPCSMRRSLKIIIAAFVLTVAFAGASLFLGAREVLHRVSAMAAATADLQSRIVDLQSVITDLRSQVATLPPRVDRLSEIVTLSEQHGVGANHTDIRIFAIKSKIAQATDPVVVIGDSITEGALLPSYICGKAVINAGVGGADVGSYISIARQVLPAQPVGLIVVALGTNNSTRTSTPADGFAASYNALLDALAPHARKLLIAGIPSVDMTGALASQYFDSAAVDRHNGEILEVAKQRSIGFINLRSESMSAETNDGVHLNADGYKPWISAMTSAISASLDCIATAATIK
jgi:lysophospholipase L1-like esterase